MGIIGIDAKITDSNLSKNVKVFSRAMIKDCEIDEGASVGDDTVLVNSKIGAFCEIDRRNYIHNSTIERFTYTGWNTYIGFSDIGKFCSISRNVDIGGQEHNYKAATTMPTEKLLQMKTGKRPDWKECKKIYIGNDVWIGQGAAILNKGGITIADGAVVAAGAVVCKDIGPYEIWGGVPARFMRYRFEKKWITALLEIQWWDFTEKTIERISDILQKDMCNDVIRQLREIKEAEPR